MAHHRSSPFGASVARRSYPPLTSNALFVRSGSSQQDSLPSTHPPFVFCRGHRDAGRAPSNRVQQGQSTHSRLSAIGDSAKKLLNHILKWVKTPTDDSVAGSWRDERARDGGVPHRVEALVIEPRTSMRPVGARSLCAVSKPWLAHGPSRVACAGCIGRRCRLARRAPALQPGRGGHLYMCAAIMHLTQW